jgi:hypothetical protein
VYLISEIYKSVSLKRDISGMKQTPLHEFNRDLYHSLIVDSSNGTQISHKEAFLQITYRPTNYIECSEISLIGH